MPVRKFSAPTGPPPTPRTTYRLAYDAVACVAHAVHFAALIWGAADMHRLGHATVFTLVVVFLVIGALFTAAFTAGAVFFTYAGVKHGNPGLFGQQTAHGPAREYLRGLTDIRVSIACTLIVFPGALLAPVIPLALLALRLRHGDFFDVRDEPKREPRAFPSQAAADVLAAADGDLEAQASYAAHHTVLNYLAVWQCALFIALNIVYRSAGYEASLGLALLMTAVCLALPVRLRCVTRDDAVCAWMNVAALHDAASALYAYALLSGLVTRDDTPDAKAQTRTGLWLLVGCLCFSGAWLLGSFVTAVVRRLHFGHRILGPGGPTLEHVVHICVAAVFLPALALGHCCGKRAVTWRMFSRCFGLHKHTEAVPRLLRDAWRWRQASGGEGDRVGRELCFQSLLHAHGTSPALAAAVAPPSAGRDGAVHPPLQRDCTKSCRAYAELWTRCHQPDGEFRFLDCVGIGERAGCVNDFGDHLGPVDSVWRVSSFAELCAVHGPPAAVWALLPVAVAASSWPTMTAAHAVFVAVQLALLAATVALLPAVVQYLRFAVAFLGVTQITQEARPPPASEIGTWAGHRYWVDAADALQVAVPPAVLPASVLRDHVAALMPHDLGEGLLAATPSECMRWQA
jgi:hypothetical protein